MRAADAFWDFSWNPFSGCRYASPGCLNCYAPGYVPLQKSRHNPLYEGITTWRFGRAVFNGFLKERPADHPDWGLPFRYKVPNPVMGPGERSICFCCDMCDLFLPEAGLLPGRPTRLIDQVVGRVAVSGHIGLLVTKHPDVMRRYFLGERSPRMRRLWQESLWLVFSAENQKWFNKRWPSMRDLARRGWFVGVCIAPMLGPVKLPADFLKYASWVICYGEQSCGSGWRPMDANWARAVKKQCREAGIPFFFKQMAGKRPIPYDLRVKDFPKLGPLARRLRKKGRNA